MGQRWRNIQYSYLFQQYCFLTIQFLLQVLNIFIILSQKIAHLVWFYVYFKVFLNSKRLQRAAKDKQWGRMRPAGRQFDMPGIYYTVFIYTRFIHGWIRVNSRIIRVFGQFFNNKNRRTKHSILQEMEQTLWYLFKHYRCEIVYSQLIIVQFF